MAKLFEEGVEGIDDLKVVQPELIDGLGDALTDGLTDVPRSGLGRGAA
jgi:hypothetical protein